jgi:hypothetical protein
MKSHILLAIALALALFLGFAGTVYGQVPNPYLPDPVDPGIYVPQAPTMVYSPIIYPSPTIYSYTPYVSTYSPIYYNYSPVVGPVYPYGVYGYGYYNSPFVSRSAFVYHSPHVVHYGPQVLHHAPVHVIHH